MSKRWMRPIVEGLTLDLSLPQLREGLAEEYASRWIWLVVTASHVEPLTAFAGQTPADLLRFARERLESYPWLHSEDVLPILPTETGVGLLAQIGAHLPMTDEFVG